MPPGPVHLLVELLLGGCVLLLLYAALHDIATRTVPNWVSVFLLVLGFALRLLQGGLLPALLACLMVFVAAAMCWRRGWMGGADVKLVAATALVVPPFAVPGLICAISLAGGVLIVVYIGLRAVVGKPSPVRPAGLLARMWRAERRRICRLETFPYASAIAAGALFIIFVV